MIPLQILQSNSWSQISIRNLDTLPITSVNNNDNSPDIKSFHSKKMITSKAWVGNVDLAIGLKRFKNALKPKNQMLSFKRQVLDKPTDIGLLPYFLGFLSCFLFMGAFLVFGHALLASPMSLTFLL